MNTLRFVHAADLHLDSPFAGFSATAPAHVAAALRDATFQAYEAIIELCLAEHVDALLVAGDIYDASDKSLRAQLRFVDGLKRLSAAGIRSFICHGNHDPLDGWEAGFVPPPGCHRFGAAVEAVPFDPGDPGRAMIYGYSYPRQRVNDNIAREFTRADDSALAIGLLHCNAGSNTGHYPYAPCTIEDLAATRMDYWALGHVHTREVLRGSGPAIVYPGNPQGRHPNETGARGVYLVELAPGAAPTLAFHAVDRVRWSRLSVEIGPLGDVSALRDAIAAEVAAALEGADGRPIVYRLELAGRGPLHADFRRDNYLGELRDELNREWQSQRQFAWCDRIADHSRPVFDREQARAGDDFLAELLSEFDDSVHEASILTPLGALFGHRGAAEYLRDYQPTVSDLPALLAAAESLSIDELLKEEAR